MNIPTIVLNTLCYILRVAQIAREKQQLPFKLRLVELVDRRPLTNGEQVRYKVVKPSEILFLATKEQLETTDMGAIFANWQLYFKIGLANEADKQRRVEECQNYERELREASNRMQDMSGVFADDPVVRASLGNRTVANAPAFGQSSPEASPSAAPVTRQSIDPGLFLRRHPLKKGLGFGIKTTVAILPGTHIVDFAGKVIMKPSTPSGTNQHVLSFPKGEGLDHVALDCHQYGNLSRYFQHSCDPNCHVSVVGGHDNTLPIMQAWSQQKKIGEGENLTIDYGDIWFDCTCGTKKCRGKANAQYKPNTVKTKKKTKLAPPQPRITKRRCRSKKKQKTTQR